MSRRWDSVPKFTSTPSDAQVTVMGVSLAQTHNHEYVVKVKLRQHIDLNGMRPGITSDYEIYFFVAEIELRRDNPPFSVVFVRDLYLSREMVNLASLIEVIKHDRFPTDEELEA